MFNMILLFVLIIIIVIFVCLCICNDPLVYVCKNNNIIFRNSNSNDHFCFRLCFIIIIIKIFQVANYDN